MYHEIPNFCIPRMVSQLWNWLQIISSGQIMLCRKKSYFSKQCTMYMYTVYTLGIRHYTNGFWWWSHTIRHNATIPKSHLDSLIWLFTLTALIILLMLELCIIEAHTFGILVSICETKLKVYCSSILEMANICTKQAWPRSEGRRCRGWMTRSPKLSSQDYA